MRIFLLSRHLWFTFWHFFFLFHLVTYDLEIPDTVDNVWVVGLSSIQFTLGASRLLSFSLAKFSTTSKTYRSTLSNPDLAKSNAGLTVNPFEFANKNG